MWALLEHFPLSWWPDSTLSELDSFVKVEFGAQDCILFQTGYLERNNFFCLHKNLRKAEQTNKESLQSTDKKFFSACIHYAKIRFNLDIWNENIIFQNSLETMSTLVSQLSKYSDWPGTPESGCFYFEQKRLNCWPSSWEGQLTGLLNQAKQAQRGRFFKLPKRSGVPEWVALKNPS